MVKYICIKEGISEEYFYYDGMLLISADLPNERILEIINNYLAHD